VLHDAHDAEDAFQATFLVLVRKAGALGRPERLGPWLYEVAYRVAVKARAGRLRRRQYEQQGVAMDALGGAAVIDEASPLVLEEVQRLPARYRVPMVLCCLEGQTMRAAARQLGWPQGTVATRLTRARALLRKRLARRGLVFSAGGFATVLVQTTAPAAVPAALIQSTVKAATLVAAGKAAAGVLSAQAVALTEGVIKAMFVANVKIVTLVLLTVGVVGAGAGTVAYQRYGPGSIAGAVQQVASAAPQEPAKPAVAKPPTVDDQAALSYGGRVLGPNGRPVADAKLYLTLAADSPTRPAPAPEVATTGLDGRFRFMVPKAKFGNLTTVVTATAASRGAAWADVPADGDRNDLTLQLVDDVPITGQVVDLEGKPVPGATLRVRHIKAAPGEDLGAWLKAAKSKRIEVLRNDFEQKYLSRATSAWSVKVTTDAEGRFRLDGCGRNRLVGAQLDGPGITSELLSIVTRPGETIAVPCEPGIVINYYGATFRHVASPTKPVVGVVRDTDTKKPLEGVAIWSNRLADDMLQCMTDAQGRYRLTGLPKGNPDTRNMIMAVPGNDQPYIISVRDVPDSPGLDPVTVDIELKRGVRIVGKITDKVTGKPLQAGVKYFALNNNANLPDYDGFDSPMSFPFNFVETKEDGSYQVAGLPGPGLVAVYHKDHYLKAPDRVDGFGTTGGRLRTSPYFIFPPISYKALAPIDPAKGVDLMRCDVDLDPGWTFKGTVLGPDGKPLTGARSFGLADRGRWEREEMKSAEFTVWEFNPRLPRDLLFQHLNKGLIGVAPPPKKNGDAVTVQMQPAAMVTGRLVDADGQPRAGVRFILEVRSQSNERQRWSSYSPERIKTDQAGGLRIDGLLPGYQFRLNEGKEDRNGTLLFGDGLRSGETKDLGDVRLTIE
jgi:RNA polymerase sigma factor (sigma-70 family)